MRLHELFARKCAVNGIACVKFDFYGCGESDGDFSEMRYMDEVEQATAIYLWASEQPWCDRDNMFPVGHSMGGPLSPTSYRSFSPGELLCGLREMWSTMISAAVSMLFRATTRSSTT